MKSSRDSRYNGSKNDAKPVGCPSIQRDTGEPGSPLLGVLLTRTRWGPHTGPVAAHRAPSATRGKPARFPFARRIGLRLPQRVEFGLGKEGYPVQPGAEEPVGHRLDVRAARARRSSIPSARMARYRLASQNTPAFARPYACPCTTPTTHSSAFRVVRTRH